MMKILNAAPKDAPFIAAIEKEQPFSAQWGEAGIKKEIENPAALVLISEESEVITGFISLRRAADSAEILNIAVSPGNTGAGHGGALLKTALDELKKEDVTSVTLEVNEINEKAAAFYKKHGFKTVNKRKKFYANTHDALIMELSL